MKATHIFCASQAAITTMDSDNHHQPSSSSTATASRAIDRHNPIIQDQKRLTRTIPTPPLPNHNHKNNNKKKLKDPIKDTDQKRKNIAFADENRDEHLVTSKNNEVVRRQGGVLLGWGCTRPGDFISPANSSRFLLADKMLSDQFDPLLKQDSHTAPLPLEKTHRLQLQTATAATVPSKIPHRASVEKVYKFENEKSSSPVKSPPRSSSSLSSSCSSEQQVVVLRVSLHCRGCEKKMRKHISKMEGVTSFNIDFMAKKVTVVGDITPLAVLTSISKVKNAKLLTPTTISTPPVPQPQPQPQPQMESNISEIKKQLGIVA